MTSKPSTTNCPISFAMLILSDVMSFWRRRSLLTCLVCKLSTPLSGGYCSGVPPLPIPNREVKPACADGTAMQCGRVGSRRLYKCEPRVSDDPRLFFVTIKECLTYGFNIQVYTQHILTINDSPATTWVNSYGSLSVDTHILQFLDYLIAGITNFKTKVMYTLSVFI